MALAFESRFSMPNSPRSDPLKKVDDKVRLWRQQAKLLEDECGVLPQNSLLVYLAVRDVHLDGEQTTAFATRKRLEEANGVALDRRAAAARFTPTLADRAFFTLGLSAEAAAAAGASVKRASRRSAATAAGRRDGDLGQQASRDGGSPSVCVERAWLRCGLPQLSRAMRRASEYCRVGDGHMPSACHRHNFAWALLAAEPRNCKHHGAISRHE
jgi:hypothetical protein